MTAWNHYCLLKFSNKVGANAIFYHCPWSKLSLKLFQWHNHKMMTFQIKTLKRVDKAFVIHCLPPPHFLKVLYKLKSLEGQLSVVGVTDLKASLQSQTLNRTLGSFKSMLRRCKVITTLENMPFKNWGTIQMSGVNNEQKGGGTLYLLKILLLTC